MALLAILMIWLPLTSAGDPSYLALADQQAEKVGMVRVIDESGEDYLYPKTFFAGIKVSPDLAKALASGT